MTENTQTTEVHAEEHGYGGSADFGEVVIGLLTAFIIGWIVFGIVSAVVIFIRSAAGPTGWYLGAALDSIKLVPPEGMNFDNVGFVLWPPANETLDMILNLLLDYGAYAVGLIAAIVGYKKFMEMDGTN